MNKFISRTFLFTFIVLIIVIVPTGVHYFVLSKVSFKLPQEKNILVLGDSHTANAIDDTIYSCVVNVSQPSGAYLYTYCNLKRYLYENDHIDTVLLSFNDIAVMDYGKSKFHRLHMIEKIPFHLTSFDREAISVFVKEDRETFVHSILNISPKMIFKFILRGGVISHKDLDIGGYWRVDRNKLREDIARHNEIGIKEATFSMSNKNYLLKIVDLCKSKNVTLILINTPTYKPEIYGNIDKVNDFHQTFLPEIEYIDYSSFALPDSCYGDIGHLNYKGAEIFSRYLQEHFSTDVKSNKIKNVSPPLSSPANTITTKSFGSVHIAN